MRFVCSEEKLPAEALGALLENFAQVMKALKIDSFSFLEISIIPERGSYPDTIFYRASREGEVRHCPIDLGSAAGVHLMSEDLERLEISEINRRDLKFAVLFNGERH
jgi:hypothetical protein